MCKHPDAQGDQCDACGRLINAIELIDPRCKLCKATPEVRASKHIFIDLAKITPELTRWVEAQAVKGGWSGNATMFTNNLLKEGLHGRCITRDLKWGTPVPHEDYQDKVFYVWFDAPIGYISITANYTGADNDHKECSLSCILKAAKGEDPGCAACKDWQAWWQNPEEVELY